MAGGHCPWHYLKLRSHSKTRTVKLSRSQCKTGSFQQQKICFFFFFSSNFCLPFDAHMQLTKLTAKWRTCHVNVQSCVSKSSQAFETLQFCCFFSGYQIVGNSNSMAFRLKNKNVILLSFDFKRLHVKVGFVVNHLVVD